jgi:hypothetical protein
MYFQPAQGCSPGIPQGVLEKPRAYSVIITNVHSENLDEYAGSDVSNDNEDNAEHLQPPRHP